MGDNLTSTLLTHLHIYFSLMTSTAVYSLSPKCCNIDCKSCLQINFPQRSPGHRCVVLKYPLNTFFIMTFQTAFKWSNWNKRFNFDFDTGPRCQQLDKSASPHLLVQYACRIQRFPGNFTKIICLLLFPVKGISKVTYKSVCERVNPLPTTTPQYP